MDRKVVIMDHPLIQHKLSILRDVDTSTMEFRELVNEIAMLMMYDATRDLPLEDKQVTTPCGVADCKVLAGRKLAFVPILRAGLGMVDGILNLIPSAKVGHIGLYRDSGAGRVLLQAAGRHRSARCVCTGSHVGNRRQRH